MNLMSCKQCGVVLDKDKIMWRSAYDDDGCAIPGAEWDGKTHVIPEGCPVCDGKIYEEEE